MDQNGVVRHRLSGTRFRRLANLGARENVSTVELWLLNARGLASMLQENEIISVPGRERATRSDPDVEISGPRYLEHGQLRFAIQQMQTRLESTQNQYIASITYGLQLTLVIV